MRNLYIFISILVITFLTSCSISNPKLTEMQGHNEDNNISVKANAEWNSEKKFYKVEAKIHNKTNKRIQMLYDCNDLISYSGKSYENGCNDAYSLGLEKGNNYLDNTEISKKLFNIDNGKFYITIRYQLDVDSEKIIDITIPLKETNK